jgi:large subunit ribosomal protein L29
MGKYRVRAKDLRAMSPDERRRQLEEWRRELISLRYKAASGTLESPGMLREYRRNIARLLTIMREEELGIRGSKAREAKG